MVEVVEGEGCTTFLCQVVPAATHVKQKEKKGRQTQTDRQTDREVHLKSSSCEAIFPIGSNLGILNKNLKINKIEKWSKVLKLYFSPAFA